MLKWFRCRKKSTFHGQCRLYIHLWGKHCWWDDHSHAKFKGNKDWQDMHRDFFGEYDDNGKRVTKYGHI